MPRALVLFTAGIVFLAIGACSSSPQVGTDSRVPQDLTDYQQLQKWLSLQQDVESMGADQVQLELANSTTLKSPDEVFYFALLNQRLETYGNWTLARDKFRELHSISGLTDPQRQLASILERYNQSRINWYKRHELIEDENRLLADENQLLRHQLALAESEKMLLQEKIQAITDLETTISTRRE